MDNNIEGTILFIDFVRLRSVSETGPEIPTLIIMLMTDDINSPENQVYLLYSKQQLLEFLQELRRVRPQANPISDADFEKDDSLPENSDIRPLRLTGAHASMFYFLLSQYNEFLSQIEYMASMQHKAFDPNADEDDQDFDFLRQACEDCDSETCVACQARKKSGQLLN